MNSNNIQNTKDFQIFVGFGGAGVNSIVEMTSLIRDDFKLGRTADRALCFLLVDTDTTELQAGLAKINENLRGYLASGSSRGVMVRTLDLGRPWARGLGFAESIENRFYELEVSSGDHYQKYCDSYWMRAPNRPFVFRHVVDPTQGASQMPLSSRIMAWWNADSVKEQIDATLSEAIRRNGGEGGRCDIFFVSSLAGGTGRGVWSTLAFMLRDGLARSKVTSHPIGIFLDGTTFHDMASVMQPRLRLNSLTGISELAMWLRNARRTDSKARYVMLHPQDPDESLAVVDTMRYIDGTASKESSDRSQKSSLRGDPIDFACLIFDENQDGLKLKNKKEYQKQAGQILYALLRHTDFRTKELNNESPEMVSLGAAVISVPIDAVKNYMNENCKLTVIEKHLSSKAAERREDGGVLESADKFIKLFGLSVDDQKKSDSASWAVWPMLAACPQKRADVLYDNTDLRTLMDDESGKKQDPKEWSAAATNLDEMASGDAHLMEREVRQAFRVAFPQDKIADDAKPEFLISRGLIRRIFDKSLADAQRSAGIRTIREKVEVVACAKEYFDGLVAFLTGAESEKKWPDGKLIAQKYPQTVLDSLLPEAPVKALAEMVDEFKGGGFWPFGSKEHFDSNEKSELKTAAQKALRDGLLAAYLPQLRNVFAAVAREMEQTQATLDSLLKLVDDEVAATKTALDEFKAKAFITDLGHEACRLVNIRDPYDQLARYSIKVRCPWDEQVARQIETAIAKQFDNSQNSESVARQSVGRLHDIFLEAAIAESSTVTDLLSADSEEYSRYRSEVRMQLKVISDSIEAPKDFLEREFSLSRVLKRYVARASNDVKYLTGKAREQLLAEYRSQLGIELDKVKMEDLKGSDLLIALAGQIGVQALPWAKYIGSEAPSKYLSSYVYVPFCKDRPEDEMINIIKDRAGVKEVILVTDNPYAITAVSCLKFPRLDPMSTGGGASPAMDNFGGIASVDYWKTSGHELRSMLGAAEKEGDTLHENLAVGGFKKDNLASRGGIGYLDPRFVDEKQPWSAIRWKPWAPPAAVRSSGLQQILAYAVSLGNFADSTAPEDREKLSRIHLSLKDLGWELPLLVREPDRRGLESADPDWKWTRYVYMKDAKTGKHHSRGVPELEWKKGAVHRNLNDLLKKLSEFSPETINYFKWEMSEFKAKLKQLDLTNEQLDKIRENSLALFDELEAEVEKNFRNKDKTTYASLKDFFHRTKLEAAFDAACIIER